MPTTPSLAQSEASRQNGARSSGPATAAGKARSSLNGVRHGLCGRTFFLLPDEDPAEFQAHEAMWLAVWSPRDLHEQDAAEAAIRAMWREIRADRLEAAVPTDLFAAGTIADDAERQAAKAAAMKALGTLLRYRGRIEREHRQATEAPSTPCASAGAPGPRPRGQANPRRPGCRLRRRSRPPCPNRRLRHCRANPSRRSVRRRHRAPRRRACPANPSRAP
jgi:hypothetical protein